MNAAVVNIPGLAPKFQTFNDPIAQEGEVSLRVLAAGLHPIVKARAAGSHYSSSAAGPAIPGIDGVGVTPDGRRVYFVFVRAPWGTMAERAVAPSATCIPIPDGLDDATAAAIANPGMSAWVTLKHRAALASGETVLIMGATGVAGQIAIQTARHLGAKRIIAAGRNVEALASAGVDAIVPLAQSDDAIRDALTAEAASGIDVVVDYLWGHPTELLLDALAKGFSAKSTRRTRLVEVGESAGKTITLPGDILRSIDLTLMGSGFGANSLEIILASIPTLFALAAAKTLTIDVDTVPLAQIEETWNRSEKGRRIVFTP